MKITRKKGNLCELRGISFIKKENSPWQHYLFISKFFNINQINGNDESYVNLIINNHSTRVSINKIYIDVETLKKYRAIDLKVGMTIREFIPDDDTPESHKIVTLKKEFDKVENKDNSWMYDDLCHLDISKVVNKEDGSAIRFMIIDGELVAKTKFSFESMQAKMATDVVNNNNNLKNFILETLDQRLAALFELVSPFNKIVLRYNVTELKLLQLRDEITGDYLDIYTHSLVKKYDVVCADNEPLELLETVAGKFIENEITEKLKDMKFDCLTDFLNYLNDA